MVFAGQNGLSLTSRLKKIWKAFPWSSVDDYYSQLLQINSNSYVSLSAEDQEKQKILTKYLKKEEIWLPDLIEAFSSSFKNSQLGQYFTPREICLLVGKIVNYEFKDRELKIYDPACGAGSLLLGCLKFNSQAEVYGQELDAELCVLARKILKPSLAIIKKGNTLTNNRFKKKFQVVVCNPPFNQLFKEEYYGSKNGNIVWVRHCLKHLKKKGLGLIILNSSCFFGNSYYGLRKELIDNNLLAGIILFKKVTTNANFNNAFVNTCLFILKKRKKKSDLVQLLDLSLIKKSKSLNKKKEIIAEELIANYWKEQKGVLVSNKKIKNHDYTLNFANYLFFEKAGKKIKEDFVIYQKKLPLEHENANCIKLPEMFFNLEHLKENIRLLDKGKWKLEEKKQDDYYLVVLDGQKSKLKALFSYLQNNLEKLKEFYQGGIIRQFLSSSFLNWQVEIKEVHE